MKKLLAILVLSLLFSGNAYANFITLSKCYFDDSSWKKEKKYGQITRNFSVNLTKGVIKHISVSKSKSGNTTQMIWDYNIYDFTENFIFARLDTTYSVEESKGDVLLRIDVKRQKAYINFGDGSSETVFYCSNNKNSSESFLKSILKKIN